MSKVQSVRAFIEQRLSLAAEEIFGVFERTISEYEEELDRHRRRTAFSANVKKFIVIKEDPPEQQERSSSLDQEDPPEPPHIKEEQEELWTNQEGEQLQDVTRFTLTPVPVKSEEDDDEEKPQSSQFHQTQTEEMNTEDDGEDCGGPEPDKNFDSRHLRAASNETSPSSETEDSNDVLKQTREPQSGLNALKNDEVPVREKELNEARKYFRGSECGNRFDSRDRLQIHMKCHTGEKTFTCSFCGKKFTKSSNLTTHLRVHTGEKPFTCSVCNTSFSLRCTLVNHMRVHTGEKPFSCSVCGKRFSKKANLTTHMALHTAEKPFKCSICHKRFTWHSQVKNHRCTDSSR